MSSYREMNEADMDKLVENIRSELVDDLCLILNDVLISFEEMALSNFIIDEFETNPEGLSGKLSKMMAHTSSNGDEVLELVAAREILTERFEEQIDVLVLTSIKNALASR